MSQTARPTPMKTRSKVIFSKNQDDQENRESDGGDTVSTVRKPPVTPRPPLTPMQSTLYNIRQKLERQLSEGPPPVEVEDKTSPGLARLRMTPGKCLKEKQQILVRKHEDARSKTDKLIVGGGVSLWPEMDNMRLNQEEMRNLVLCSVGLLIGTLCAFMLIHGSLIHRLQENNRILLDFNNQHPILMNMGNVSFTTSLLHWHNSYRKTLSDTDAAFNVNLSRAPVPYYICMLLYVGALGMLLYYLVDNMVAKNKLTPKRIKIWVSLLIVTGTWTCLLLKMLICAQRVERSIEKNVYKLNNLMGDLVSTDLDLSKYTHILQYWTTRCLPPRTQGTLTIVGVLPVRDVAYYLQYYSLPVITALLTPVVKLIYSLRTVYSVNKYA